MATQYTREELLARFVCNADLTQQDFADFINSVAIWLSDPNIGLLEWRAGVQYRQGECVAFNGKIYQVANQIPPVNSDPNLTPQVPPTNASYWRPLNIDIPVVPVTDIVAVPQIQLLPVTYSNFVWAWKSGGLGGGNDAYTLYVRSPFSTRPANPPYVVPAAGGGRWVAISGRYSEVQKVNVLQAVGATVDTDLSVNGLINSDKSLAIRSATFRFKTSIPAGSIGQLPPNAQILDAKVLCYNCDFGAGTNLPDPIFFRYGGLGIGSIDKTTLMAVPGGVGLTAWYQLNPDGDIANIVETSGSGAGGRTLSTNITTAVPITRRAPTLKGGLDLIVTYYCADGPD